MNLSRVPSSNVSFQDVVIQYCHENFSPFNLFYSRWWGVSVKPTHWIFSSRHNNLRPQETMVNFHSISMSMLCSKTYSRIMTLIHRLTQTDQFNCWSDLPHWRNTSRFFRHNWTKLLFSQIILKWTALAVCCELFGVFGGVDHWNMYQLLSFMISISLLTGMSTHDICTQIHWNSSDDRTNRIEKLPLWGIIH